MSSLASLTVHIPNGKLYTDRAICFLEDINKEKSERDNKQTHVNCNAKDITKITFLVYIHIVQLRLREICCQLVKIQMSIRINSVEM